MTVYKSVEIQFSIREFFLVIDEIKDVVSVTCSDFENFHTC